MIILLEFYKIKQNTPFGDEKDVGFLDTDENAEMLLKNDVTDIFSLYIKGKGTVSIKNVKKTVTEKWQRIIFYDIPQNASLVFSPGSYYIFCGKLEKGNKATDWTPAPEDTEESITEVKTIAEQTADKFNWLVKSGTSSTDFTLTDRVASLLSEQFNIDALTTFKNSAENGTSTVINGGAIKAKTIKASSIDVDNLFAQDITATGTITGATLKGTTAEIDAGKIGPLSIASDDRNLRFDLSDSYYLRIGGQIYGKGINIFDNSGFTQVIYSSSGIWMRDEKDAGWDTVITPSRITIGDFIHGTSTEGFEINVPTTVRNALRVESDSSGSEKSYARLNNHEVQLHAMNSSVVFSLSAYSGSSNKFKLYSTTGNIVDITDTTAMTITPKVTASNGIAEQGYDVIGCEVTTSGDFTCKKYRDGRLVIEYRSRMVNGTSLTDVSEGLYSKSIDGRTFPVAFVDTPMVITGIGVPNLSAPFVNVSFDGVSKTGYSRCIFWATHSGAKLPLNSVTSAIFIGRWF